jgi:hypothetical protein
MDTFLNNKLKRLQNFTASLSCVVESAVPVIREISTGKVVLPKGCKSKESLALMELGRVDEKIREVTAAATGVRKTLAIRIECRKSGSPHETNTL